MRYFMENKERTTKQELTMHKHGDHCHATNKYPYTKKLPSESESKRDEKV